MERVQNTTRNKTVRLTVTALLMAMNIVLSMSIFSIPVPGGHFYLNDIVICLAAILLDPVEAFAVGGIGAFLGDLLFYPAPMFVSLVTRGLQAVVISLIAHKTFPSKPRIASLAGAVIGAVIMVAGYTIGRAFIYSTPEYAVAKLPFQVLMALGGVVIAPILVWNCGLKKVFCKTVGEPYPDVSGEV